MGHGIWIARKIMEGWTGLVEGDSLMSSTWIMDFESVDRDE